MRIQKLQQDRTRAQEKSSQNTRFLATLSHEIRNPLAGMLGVTEVLRQSQLDPRQKEYVETLRYSGNALLGMLDNTLDFSRSEEGGGQIRIAESRFEPRRLLDSVVLLYSARAREKDITLTSHPDPALPAVLVGDPVRLRQVIINLVSNAVKFTQGGNIDLTAELEFLTNEACAVRFRVRDNGPGIPPDKCARIFDRYVQLNSNQGNAGGAGLGLFISREIVKALGGHIDVKSTLGVGSEFYFTVRFRCATDNENEPAVGLEVEQSRPLTILLVDDEPINLKVTSSLLEQMGHQVVHANSGLKALHLIDEKHFDLLLLDIQMPRMDGVEVCRRIRMLSDPQRSSLPIIAVTANMQPEAHQEYLDSGIDFVLTKPLNTVRFNQALAKLQIAGEEIKESQDEELIDHAILKGYQVNVPPATFERTLSEFEQSSRELMETLQHSMRKQQHDVVQGTAHQLAGISGMLGMRQLWQICTEIESRFATMDDAGREAFTKHLRTIHERTLAASEQYRSSEQI